MRRILVTGARRWTDAHLLGIALCRTVVLLQVPPQRIVLVHGDADGTNGAEGADKMAARLGARLGMVIDSRPADWPTCVTACPRGHRRRSKHGEYCPDAGFRRDGEMVDLLAPEDYVLAFALRWASGTGHCARRARDAGLQVVDWGVDTSWAADPMRRRRRSG